MDQIQPYMERSIYEGKKASVIGLGLIHRSRTQDFFINHREDFFRFAFFLQGEGMIVREGADVTVLDTPCAFQFREGEHYSILPSPGSTWTEFSVRIDASVINTLTEVGLLPPLTGIIKVDNNEHFARWMGELTGQMVKMPVEFLPELFFDVQRFLIAFCHSREKEMKASYYYPIIAEAKQLIKNTAANGQHIDSQAMAEYFHMSTAHFTRVFKLFTGLTPSQYAMHFKIHYAEHLLDIGMSVKETASSIGYADPFIFSKQFKKITGCSPKERRQGGPAAKK